MDRVSLDYAREHLDELVERARKGEAVEIADPNAGNYRLTAIEPAVTGRRQPGRLKGKLPPPPDDFFAPMDAAELKLWEGP